jgi:Putative DNA-binding domain
MLLKPLREVGLQDVEELIGNVAEDLHVDFKQGPVGIGDADRKEFVADVTAFANAAGGDIVFGIVEGPDAVASQVLGIRVDDIDAEERRLAEIIRNGTEPRLTDFDFKWIEHPPNGQVMILRVGRSWRAPHRGTLAGHDRFYIRNTRGKHPMNTDELRTAFTAGQALEDRIASFQRARIGLIVDGEGPVDMGGGPKLVLHAVPLVSFADPPDVRFRYGELLQSPLGGGGVQSNTHARGSSYAHRPAGRNDIGIHTSF